MGILVNESQIGGGGTSNTSHNVGDIFYTTRTDNSLNGAVECNGSQYNFSDFDSNLQALFDEGKLPYLPIYEFDSMVTNQGGCDSFGYGTNDEITLYPLEPYQVDGIAYYSNVYDWDAVEPDPNEKYILHGVKIYDKDTHEELVGYYVTNDPVTTGGWYYELYNANNELVREISSPSHNSEEPITVPVGDEFQATTYFKVPKKLSRVLVRCKKPTDDDKSWYNVYADGWVEQGGVSTVSSGTGQIIFTGTLPIPLQNNNGYFVSSSFNWGSGASRAIVNSYLINNGTTIHIVAETLNQSTTTGTGKFIWEVKGYADPTEYTKDKWNYQNIQVERCMVQLFNSTTDTAVATCNQVLADVSALNGQDSVIYWDSYEASDHSHAYSNITLTEHQWYRIYKSGWVEQGGIILNAGINQHTITIPIEMNNVEELKKGTTVYPIYISGTIQNQGVNVRNSTNSAWSSNTIDCFSWGATIHIKWEVKGYMLSTQS